MRATLAWIFILTAGFAAFLGLATLALLPMQAAKNRATYAVAERYANKLVASLKLPTNANVDDASIYNVGGIRIWRSLPGGCYDTAFEAPSDRFVLGFWENGNENRFDSIWWHCYAYPSGKTTLKLSVTDYLTSAAGQQVFAYLLIAVITGLMAFALRARSNQKSLKLLTKAIWFSIFMSINTVIFALQDLGDDEFFKNTEHVKWFAYVFEKTIFSFIKMIIISDHMSPAVASVLMNFWPVSLFATWLFMGWALGYLISFVKLKGVAIQVMETKSN